MASTAGRIGLGARTCALLAAGLATACMPWPARQSSQSQPQQQEVGAGESCSSYQVCKPGLRCVTSPSILGNGFTNSICQADPEAPSAADQSEPSDPGDPATTFVDPAPAGDPSAPAEPTPAIDAGVPVDAGG